MRLCCQKTGLSTLTLSLSLLKQPLGFGFRVKECHGESARFGTLGAQKPLEASVVKKPVDERIIDSTQMPRSQQHPTVSVAVCTLATHGQIRTL